MLPQLASGRRERFVVIFAFNKLIREAFSCFVSTLTAPQAGKRCLLGQRASLCSTTGMDFGSARRRLAACSIND